MEHKRPPVTPINTRPESSGQKRAISIDSDEETIQKMESDCHTAMKLTSRLSTANTQDKQLLQRLLPNMTRNNMVDTRLSKPAIPISLPTNPSASVRPASIVRNTYHRSRVGRPYQPRNTLNTKSSRLHDTSSKGVPNNLVFTASVKRIAKPSNRRTATLERYMLNDESSPAEVIGTIGERNHKQQQQQQQRSSPSLSALVQMTLDNSNKPAILRETSIEHVKTTRRAESASPDHDSLSLVTEYLSSSGGDEDTASPHESIESEHHSKSVSKKQKNIRIPLTSLFIGQYEIPTGSLSLEVTPKRVLMLHTENEGTIIIRHKRVKYLQTYMLQEPFVLRISTTQQLDDPKYAKDYRPFVRSCPSSWIVCVMNSGKDELCDIIHLLDPDETRHSLISQQDWREIIGLLVLSTQSDSTTNTTATNTATNAATATTINESPDSPSSSPISAPASPLPPINSFVYPFDGVKAIAISNNDYQRLRDGEFLNDTIIDFYLRYHLDSLKCTPQLLDKVHLFNTFFYHKLTQHQNNDSSEGGYHRVRSWTNKVDIFSKRFIFIPINENLHWYLVLIGNLDQWIKSQMPAKDEENEGEGGEKEEETDYNTETGNSVQQEQSIAMSTRSKALDTYKTPFIAIFDSLGKTCYQTVFKTLRNYISAAASDKLGIDNLDTKQILGRYAKVPIQDNYCDCGLFLISYAVRYLEVPNLLTYHLLHKSDTSELWFTTEEASRYRAGLRETMVHLSREYMEFKKRL